MGHIDTKLWPLIQLIVSAKYCETPAMAATQSLRETPNVQVLSTESSVSFLSKSKIVALCHYIMKHYETL